jgi:beta-mannosidase
MTTATDVVLSGSWQVRRLEPGGEQLVGGSEDWLEAAVPGAIQYDLMRAGRLGNPFAGAAGARDSHWVFQADWLYRLRFAVRPSGRQMLVFDNIDTFGEIRLNGKPVGSTANALHGHRFDVSELLVDGDNELLVLVHHHEWGVQDKIPEARRRLGHTSGIEGLLGKSLVRRYPRSFMSASSLLNVGTSVLGIGILGDVRLETVAPVGIADLRFETVSLAEGIAHTAVTVSLSTTPDRPVTVTARLRPAPGGDRGGSGADDVAAEAAAVSVDGTATVRLSVDQPRLWWPRGYGDADLYLLEVEVFAGDALLDRAESTVGIRTIELRTDRPGERATFELVVNEVPIWVRGTNYIPVDYLSIHGGSAAQDRVFDLLVAGQHNLVRMWGGGAPESDSFYAQCDRRGILVWQDCYLHSNTYPDYDPGYVAAFEVECGHLMRSVRNHPSLAVLCGGNEQLEGWEEWQWKDALDEFYGETLFRVVARDVAAAVAPRIPFVENSPHGPVWAQSPVDRDSHTWGNHFNSTKDPVFVTETCWGQESYSRPETLAEVMDLDPEEFRGPHWMTKWTERTSLPILIRFPYTGYHNTGGLREYLLGLEVEQAMADYFSLGNFRLHSPSCRGIVYWSFNKGGPLFQFGAVDYRLRPLASHYVVGRLYRQVVVGVYRDVDDVRVVASNAGSLPLQAQLEVTHVRSDGSEIDRWYRAVTIRNGSPVRLTDLTDRYATVRDRRNEAVYARLSDDQGAEISSDMLFFCPISEFVSRGELSVDSVRCGQQAWEVTVATSGVSKMVRIAESDGLILSDNYFPLVSGRPIRIQVRTTDPQRPPVLVLRDLDDEGPGVTVILGADRADRS